MLDLCIPRCFLVGVRYIEVREGCEYAHIILISTLQITFKDFQHVIYSLKFPLFLLRTITYVCEYVWHMCRQVSIRGIKPKRERKRKTDKTKMTDKKKVKKRNRDRARFSRFQRHCIPPRTH